MLAEAAAVAVGFTLGSIPTAYILGRIVLRADIRDIGSGNPGTLNTTSSMGKAAGLFVLLVDAGKGILTVVIAQAMAIPDMWLYTAAFAAALGHNFSPFLRFEGGKGVAVALGIFAYMLWQITAISTIAGILLLIATRRPVLSIFGIFIGLNVLTIATGQDAGQIVLCIAISLLVAGTHLWRQQSEGAAESESSSPYRSMWRRFIGI